MCGLPSGAAGGGGAIGSWRLGVVRLRRVCCRPPNGRTHRLASVTRFSWATARRHDLTEASLYERLGGAFAIAAVVDHFSAAVVRNPIVGQASENPALREWHAK